MGRGQTSETRFASSLFQEEFAELFGPQIGEQLLCFFRYFYRNRQILEGGKFLLICITIDSQIFLLRISSTQPSLMLNGLGFALRTLGLNPLPAIQRGYELFFQLRGKVKS